MPRLVRSARGEIVDFDLIAIANQLASAPPPVTVGDRRLFIDEKDGVKQKKNSVAAIPDQVVHEALRFAQEGVKQQSRSSAKSKADEQKIVQDPSLARPTYNQDADPV